MEILFTEEAHEDYQYWKRHNVNKAKRIDALCRDIAQKPFEGIGKPEPLKFDLRGRWSRRIDRTHRLIYLIRKEGIIIEACRFHY